MPETEYRVKVVAIDPAGNPTMPRRGMAYTNDTSIEATFRTKKLDTPVISFNPEYPDGNLDSGKTWYIANPIKLKITANKIDTDRIFYQGTVDPMDGNSTYQITKTEYTGGTEGVDISYSGKVTLTAWMETADRKK